ncbi:unnamed protein product, partial [Meganyctiphanes norvegica]
HFGHYLSDCHLMVIAQESRNYILKSLYSAGFPAVAISPEHARQNPGQELLRVVHLDGRFPCHAVIIDVATQGHQLLSVLEDIHLWRWANPYILMLGAASATPIELARPAFFQNSLRDTAYVLYL